MRMSQSLTAFMHVSQLSQVPPPGGASSFIQTSNAVSPKSSCARISFLSSLRILESVGLFLSLTANRSLHRLEIMIRMLREMAMEELLCSRRQIREFGGDCGLSLFDFAR